MAGFGEVHVFERRSAEEREKGGKGKGAVTFVKALWGGHNEVGLQESLVDFLAEALFARDRD